MNSFHKLLDTVTSSSCHDQILRFVTPLNDHLGINHFWYYKITFSGYYSYFGTHSKWNEYCFDNAIVSHFPCLRHPDILKSGITLMKASGDVKYKKVLKTAWNKFNINFNINLQEKTPEGIEAFGFATHFNDPKNDERLLNDLSLLRSFTKIFRIKHKKLFQLLEDNQVKLSDQFGAVFYEHPKDLNLPCKRDVVLRKLGFNEMFFLTPREIDVLKFMVHGYPAGFIGEKLQISQKTVENYMSTIKCKLSCESKVELIEKAREMESIGFFKS